MSDSWEGQAPIAQTDWEGQAPTSEATSWEGQAPAQQSKTDVTKFVTSPKNQETDNTFWGDVGNRIVGTGIDLAELGGAVSTVMGKYVVAVHEGLKNLDKTVEERRTIAGKAMQEYVEDATVRSRFPNTQKYEPNPAIQGVMEGIDKPVSAIASLMVEDPNDPRHHMIKDALMFGGGAALLKATHAAAKPTKATRPTDVTTAVDDLKVRLEQRAKGVDVDESHVKSPYMSNKELQAAKEVVEATGEPAFGELTTPITDEAAYYAPWWADAEFEAAKVKANRRANAIDNLPASADMAVVDTQPPITRYRKEFASIESQLPKVLEGHTRLWRGNREGEIGLATRFTDDASGIALPFRDAYKGSLSYVDVPTLELSRFDQSVASPNEYNLPHEIAAKAKEIKNIIKQPKTLDDDITPVTALSTTPLDFASRMAKQRAQEVELGNRFSEMSGDEIEATYQSIKKENDVIEREAIKKFLGTKKLAEYDSLTSRRKRDTWLEQNITIDAQDYMNEHMQPEAFAEQFRGAAGAFNETSPKALGESIAVLSKDVDKPGFMATPNGVTFKAALRYAMEQGWNMDDVLAGMRNRAHKWAGDDSRELFIRLFKSTNNKSSKILLEQPKTLVDDITPSYSFEKYEKHAGGVAHKPEVVAALDKATTAVEAAKVFDPHVPESLRLIWDKILPLLDESTQFQILHRGDVRSAQAIDMLKKDSLGVAGYDLEGNQYIAVGGLDKGLRNSGLDVATFAHEAYHTITKNALRLGNDASLIDNPKYAPHRQFAAEAYDIYQNVVKNIDPVLKDVFKNQLENIDEFVTWGNTDLTFGNVLKNISGVPENLFTRWKRAIYNLFGVVTKPEISAMDRLMSLNSKLENVQATPAEMKAYYERKATQQNPKESAMKLEAQMAEYNNFDEVKAAIRPQFVPDLPEGLWKTGFSHTLTTNQLRDMFNHPYTTFLIDHIKRIGRQEEVRVAAYKEYLRDTFKLPRADKLNIYGTLVKLQNPELRPLREAAEQSGKRVELLVEHGLDPKLAEHATRVLDIFKDAYEADMVAAQRVGRKLNYEPMYFPRSHSGIWKVFVRDINDMEGTPKAIKGFDSAREAQDFQQQLKKSLSPDTGYIVEDVKRTNVGTYQDAMADMIMETGLPDFIQKQVLKLEQTDAAKKRIFEMQRAGEGVAGYIGEVISGNESPLSKGFKNDQKLLDLVNQRLQNSYRFATQSRIISEISNPMMFDLSVLDGKPNLQLFASRVIARELGYDVSRLKAVDRSMQTIVDKQSKALNRMWLKYKGYEPTPIEMVSPNFVRDMTQHMTYLVSLWKLGMNTSVLLANAGSIPFVVLDGFRTAGREGVNPSHALKAYYQTLSELKDPKTLKFMQRAKEEGMITSNAADLYSVDPETQSRILTTLNKPRNIVEDVTNYMAIQYYYHYYKNIFAERGIKLDPTSEAFKTQVYNAARSWTGDYSALATPLYFSEMGTLGHAQTNFSKWKWNQIGRLVNDIETVRSKPESWVSFMPILATFSMSVFLSGLLGSPGAVEYEAIRRIGSQYKWFDWAPASSLMKEAVRHGLLDKDQAQFLEDKAEWFGKGIFTNVLDDASQQVFNESSPDISEQFRYASGVDAPTVMFRTMWDIVAGSMKIGKWVGSKAGMTNGLTYEDREVLIKALPTSLQPVFKKKFQETKRGNETISQFPRKQQGLYARSDWEENMSLLGLTSLKENRTVDQAYYTKYVERVVKDGVNEKIQSLLTNPDQAMKLIPDIVNTLGPTTSAALVRAIKNNYVSGITTYDERMVRDMAKNINPITKARLADQLEYFQQLRQRNTSTDH